MIEIKKEVSLDEKISQMLILGYFSRFGYKTILKNIAENKISGVIFFRRNIKNPTDIKQKILKIKEVENKKLPAFTVIDQEGGQVSRIAMSNGFKYYPGAERIANEFGPQKSAEIYDDMIASLADIGINLNLAPCIDMKTNENSSIAYNKRSYGDNPETVTLFGDILIEANKKNGVIPSLKHFPGIGSASIDTHKQLPDITDTWSEKELVPYQELIKKNPDIPVMIGHVINKKIDEENICSLSPKAISILKDKMGHAGPVIMDATNMSALKKYSIDEIVIKAINAGINLFIFTNRFYSLTNAKRYMRPKKFISIVKKAIKNGDISEKTIDDAYDKIVDFKGKYIIK